VARAQACGGCPKWLGPLGDHSKKFVGASNSCPREVSFGRPLQSSRRPRSIWSVIVALRVGRARRFMGIDRLS
jgi:hypothetical protein